MKLKKSITFNESLRVVLTNINYLFFFLRKNDVGIIPRF